MRVTLTTEEVDDTLRWFETEDLRGHITPGTNPMLRRVLDWWRWIRLCGCIIRDINEQLVPLVPNRTQRTIAAIFLMQAAARRPLRLVVFKARKVGVSTFVESLAYFLPAHHAQQVCGILAHIASSTDEIFGIAKTMYERWTAIPQGDSQKRLLKFQESRLWCQTAGGKSVGAGGTPNFLHVSEFALWSTNARETEAAALNSVPMTPTSTIVVESSCRGRNRFWDYWEMSLVKDSAYDGLFVPWYWDETLRAPVPPDFEATEDEVILVKRAGDDGVRIEPTNLQWRRLKISEIGPGLFRQEFPSTPQEALEAYSDLVLPGLRECSWVGVDTSGSGTGGIDFGYHDPTAIIDAVCVDQCYHVFNVWRQSGALAATQAKHVQDGFDYWCDPSGLQQREELRAACDSIGKHCGFQPAPRPQDERATSFVNARFEMVRKVAAEGRLFIYANGCEQLLLEADCLLYSERTGQPDYRRTEQCGHFDTLDALCYLVVGNELAAPIAVPRIAVHASERAGLRR